MGRITIFPKGNLDVRDSLHSLRIGGKLLWNGINEMVRARLPGTLVRLRQEIVRSKVEADRLRLTLISLAKRTAPAEVIVVDDGSTDHGMQS